MIKINNINDFIKYSDKLPLPAVEDIDQRIGDWLATGGKLEDEYIKQQLRYAEKILNLVLIGETDE